jgi:hypothetical protein
MKRGSPLASSEDRSTVLPRFAWQVEFSFCFEDKFRVVCFFYLFFPPKTPRSQNLSRFDVERGRQCPCDQARCFSGRYSCCVLQDESTEFGAEV